MIVYGVLIKFDITQYKQINTDYQSFNLQNNKRLFEAALYLQNSQSIGFNEMKWIHQLLGYVFNDCYYVMNNKIAFIENNNRYQTIKQIYESGIKLRKQLEQVAKKKGFKDFSLKKKERNNEKEQGQMEQIIQKMSLLKIDSKKCQKRNKEDQMQEEEINLEEKFKRLNIGENQEEPKKRKKVHKNPLNQQFN